MQLQLKVNGAEYSVETAPERTLLQVLREDLGLTGAKEGCGMGDCGACTVLLDGAAVAACLLLAPSAREAEITTIEGLGRDGALAPLQLAFVQQDAVQCGFCTAGMILAAHALLARNPQPTAAEIRHELAGNLCRCTGYQQIFAAVQAAAQAGVRP